MLQFRKSGFERGIFMIEYTKGNMFDSGADCMVNTVNCEGFMGKGIAYQFKMRFPENFKSYEKACRSHKLTVGTMHYYVEDGITIVNFPTKDKWRADSKMEYIEDGMDAFVKILPQLNVKKIVIPPLGCGNGGLQWGDVKAVIERKLQNLSEQYDFVIYEPSQNYRAKSKQPPKVSVSALVILDIRMQLEKANGLRLQKACYFTNYFYNDNYFKFDKYKYGPYSYAVDIVAKNLGEYQEYYALENSEDTFNHIYQVICSVKTNRQYNKIHQAVKKAVAFVNEIEDDKKLEGVATVAYLVETGRPKNQEELIQAFDEWSEYKAKKFSDAYIAECIRYLEEKNIIISDLCGNYELAKNVW